MAANPYMASVNRITSFLKYKIRISIIGFLSFFLYLRSRKLPLVPCESLLIISPHQDDEALGCTGAIAQKAMGGGPLNIAYITDGSASHPKCSEIDPLKLSHIRKQEAKDAMSYLGVSSASLSFFDVKDGTLDRLNNEEHSIFVSSLSDYLQDLKPTLIMLPCRSDGSSEHDATFKLVSDAVKLSGITTRFLEYPVWSWWRSTLLIRPALTCPRIWCLSSPDLKAKRSKTLAHYKSQFAPLQPLNVAVLPHAFFLFFVRNREYYFEW